METKKSLIKIEKRHEVRKMERFINNTIFELNEKVKKSYGKHWTIHDYKYHIVIYQFLMSELSEMNKKINYLYKLIDYEKFKEFDSTISDFKDIDISMYNMEIDDEIFFTDTYIAYNKICLINLSDELIDSLTDGRYRFPRCCHFHSKVTHHLNTTIGKFLICDKCAKLMFDNSSNHYNLSDDGNLNQLFEDHEIHFFNHAYLKKLPESIKSFI